MSLSNYGRGRGREGRIHYGSIPADVNCGATPDRYHVTCDKQKVTCKRCQGQLARAMARGLDLALREHRKSRGRSKGAK